MHRRFETSRAVIDRPNLVSRNTWSENIFELFLFISLVYVSYKIRTAGSINTAPPLCKQGRSHINRASTQRP